MAPLYCIGYIQLVLFPELPPFFGFGGLLTFEGFLRLPGGHFLVFYLLCMAPFDLSLYLRREGFPSQPFVQFLVDECCHGRRFDALSGAIGHRPGGRLHLPALKTFADPFFDDPAHLFNGYAGAPI